MKLTVICKYKYVYIFIYCICACVYSCIIKIPYYSAIPLISIYPEKSVVQNDTHIPMFNAALFTVARTWKQPKCPSTKKWINKSGTSTQGNITQPSKGAKSCHL